MKRKNLKQQGLVAPPTSTKLASTSGYAVEIAIGAAKWDKNIPWEDQIDRCGAGVSPWEEVTSQVYPEVD